MQLKEIFTNLISRFTSDKQIATELWTEIEKKYSGPKRHYHTLVHLEALINQLQECKDKIADWDTILFSVFYHDIIYNVLKTDNEERSAGLAVKRLTGINFPALKIQLCKEQVLATKAHTLSDNPDTNLFTDADLSILGQSPTVYEQYYRQVRKEYSIYPDLIYKPGRKKVLDHFLNMPRIFKTQVFLNKYEKQARENLLAERASL